MAFLGRDWTGEGVDFRSGLWRLNVTPDAQGRGVGRFAVESVAAEVRHRGSTQMYVRWEPGEDGPEGFYRKLGFQLTGEKSGARRSGCWICRPFVTASTRPQSAGRQIVLAAPTW
jgi:diamine N-acetyltransferase